MQHGGGACNVVVMGVRRGRVCALGGAPCDVMVGGATWGGAVCDMGAPCDMVVGRAMWWWSVRRGVGVCATGGGRAHVGCNMGACDMADAVRCGECHATRGMPC